MLNGRLITMIVVALVSSYIGYKYPQLWQRTGM